MNSWDELSMAEKADVMKLAVEGGVYDLDAIRSGYNEYAKGGKIHIAPSKRGTFTAAASKHGKSVQAFASQVLAHKENYSPAMVKKANFARNAAKWKHEDGGNLDDNEPSFLTKTALWLGKTLGIDKSFKGEDNDIHYRQNIYNMVDPTDNVPNEVGRALKFALDARKAKSEETFKKRRKYEDPAADAAWAKRLGLPYDKTILIDNKDGSVRLSKELEAQIPIDTIALKKRIAENEERLNQVYGDKRKLTGLALDYDRQALDSLRETYRTGKSVQLDENSAVGRNWRAGDTEKAVSPLNLLHRYTVQYNKDNNTMNYWDLYDFNSFEDFVPGKPFKIKGSIKLNK